MSIAHCPHCAALQDEIGELRRSLGLAAQLTEQAALKRALGLTRAEASLVQALWCANGRVMPRSNLDAVVLKPSSWENGADSLKAVVYRTRRKLGHEAISTVLGGYALAPAGRAKVAEVLGTAVP